MPPNRRRTDEKASLTGKIPFVRLSGTRSDGTVLGNDVRRTDTKKRDDVAARVDGLEDLCRLLSVSVDGKGELFDGYV